MSINAKGRKKGLFIIGILSIIVGVICLCQYGGSYETDITYGGDAYTGIQNASAQAANNLLALSWIVKLGFGSTLIISGLVLIVIASTIVTQPFESSYRTNAQNNSNTVSNAPESTVQTPKESALVDEIAKYNSLLESGAITQEEYEKGIKDFKSSLKGG